MLYGYAKVPLVDISDSANEPAGAWGTLVADTSVVVVDDDDCMD